MDPVNLEHRKPKWVITIPHKFMYTWIVSFIAMALLTGAAIQYSNYVDRKSNERWCGVVVTLDNSYQKTPPQTAAGQDIAREMKKLRREFRCDR